MCSCRRCPLHAPVVLQVRIMICSTGLDDRKLVPVRDRPIPEIQTCSTFRDSGATLTSIDLDDSLSCKKVKTVRGFVYLH